MGGQRIVVCFHRDFRQATNSGSRLQAKSMGSVMFTDQQLMQLAIAQAHQCRPEDPDKTPMVGAVIVKDGTILAMGSRQADTHAEKYALDQITDRSRLAGATVYTTLEPCTPAVRSKPEESCTTLLVTAQLAKVVIGILDPNQQVCGKGVLEMQKHDVEVALFPHDLAMQIRTLNDRFIRMQGTLGLRFIGPLPGAQLPTYQTDGRHTFRCTCLNEPGADKFVLVERNGLWWPQADRLRHVKDQEYVFDCTFGSIGPHTIHVVRGNDLDIILHTYYRRIVDRNKALRRELEAKKMAEALDELRRADEYPGIPMTRLPRGLDSQGSINVEVMPKSAEV
jgi:pyrimidine deaminase RibD-like protein